MTELEPVLDFASSGRSGRRNALPDVLGSPAGVTPSDLPLKLAELTLAEGTEGISPQFEAPTPPSESAELKDGSEGPGAKRRQEPQERGREEGERLQRDKDSLVM
ncbi:cAMP-dependent protein kinase inhibitor beta-like [Acipenser oxyrinchus oxyrinchus]|uniref:cAMP-dependent protein kinase inhibitor beta-like n=1 Tax=Acipenser oxyrinchus oxyrinchus TaxID=40147 RepID=A0AAD8CUK0_ACIOX|nr:cAMP-dependent protein kinase inhibitor beta-like [Acipenser oxyrinchus oxyrinchus]